MSRKTKNRRSGGRLSVPLKILAVIAVTLLLLCAALFSALAVFARGIRGTAADRFSATVAERGGLVSRLLYPASETAEALSYRPPREAEEISAVYRSPAGSAVAGEFAGRGWKGVAQVIPAGGAVPVLTLNSEGSDGSEASIGLDGFSDIIFSDGCVRYAGEGGESLYCVVACDASGRLRIGGMTVAEIANSGFEWGVSATRVLISGGVPQSGLGGGYASRAAVGQTADGDYVLFCAETTGFYPCGITYDELASLMYSLGCVNAAALDPREGMKIGGKTAVPAAGKAGRSLVFVGKEAGVD